MHLRRRRVVGYNRRVVHCGILRYNRSLRAHEQSGHLHCRPRRSLVRVRAVRVAVDVRDHRAPGRRFPAAAIGSSAAPGGGSSTGDLGCSVKVFAVVIAVIVVIVQRTNTVDTCGSRLLLAPQHGFDGVHGIVTEAFVSGADGVVAAAKFWKVHRKRRHNSSTSRSGSSTQQCRRCQCVARRDAAHTSTTLAWHSGGAALSTSAHTCNTVFRAVITAAALPLATGNQSRHCRAAMKEINHARRPSNSKHELAQRHANRCAHTR